MTESIEIKLTDSVAPSISANLKDIGTHAKEADASIKGLQGSLKGMSGVSAFQKIQADAAKLALQQERLSKAQNQTAISAQRLVSAQNQAAAAGSRAAIAALKLEQAQGKAAVKAKALSAALSPLRVALLGIVSAIGVGSFAQMTSELTDLHSRVQRITGDGDSARETFKRLQEMAQRTYSDFNLTAESFLSNSNALRELGYTTKGQLDYTEALNNALVVSGAKAERAEQVQTALSKAMAMGSLQGVNLNTVIQNGGRVAELLAEQLGVNVNELRRVGSEGRITGSVIYSALAGNLIKTREEAEAMPATIQDGFQQIKNAVKQAVFDFDQMTGLSEKLAGALVWVSKNLDIVAIAAAGMGVAALAAFGGPLLGAIDTATKAVIKFTTACATNPILLAAIAITALVIVLYKFRDAIKLGVDETTTLGDLFRAVWYGMKVAAEFVGGVVSHVWGQIKEAANTALKFVSDLIAKFSTSASSNFQLFFKTTYSGWLGLVEMAARAIDTIAGKTAGLFNFVGSYREGRKAGKSIGQIWSESFAEGMNFKPAETLLHKFVKKAQEIGAERLKAPAAATGGGGGRVNPPTATGDGGAAKAAIDRAAALQQVNKALDDELRYLFMLAPAREQAQKFDQIAAQLASKNITLTKTEADAIKTKIAALQAGQRVQAQMDAMYNEVTTPLQEYNAAINASNNLLAQGAISQERHIAFLTRAKDAYEAATKGPIEQFANDLKYEFELLKKLPAQREIDLKIERLRQQQRAAGLPANEAYLEQLREELRLLGLAQEKDMRRTSLLDGSQGGEMAEFQKQIEAINALKNDPAFTKNDSLNALGGMDVGQYLVGSPEFMQSEIDRLSMFYGQVDELRNKNLINEQTAEMARTKIKNEQDKIQLAGTKAFFGELEGLQRSNIRELAMVGKAAAISNATIKTYEAANAALAAYPPPQSYAAAAAAVAMGLANVAQIVAQPVGYKDGGYTGNGGVNEIAGPVHRGEYVLNAATTARLGVNNLDALQSGAAQVRRTDSNVGAPIQYSPSAADGYGEQAQQQPQQTNLRIINTLDPALVGEYLATPEGERVFINTIRRNSDTVRQAINA